MKFEITTPDGESSAMAHEVKNGNAHYFAGSATNWKIGTCLLTVMSEVKAYDKRCVKNRGMAATDLMAIYVPVPIDTDYRISDYKPVVEGIIVLAVVDYAEELRKYAKRIK